MELRPSWEAAKQFEGSLPRSQEPSTAPSIQTRPPHPVPLRSVVILVTALYRGKSRASVATGYGLDVREVAVRAPVDQEFSLLCIVQTGSGVHTTSSAMGTGGSYLGVKRQGREADRSLPTSAKVKNRGSIHPPLHTSGRSA
jgi:hypothetical protein